jgi:hypothetical protein
MKKIVAFFILLLICNAMVYSANQVQTNLESGSYQIEAKTATIALNISENQSVTVFKDTLLFEEDFSNFVRPTSATAGTIIGGENVLTLLPSSMTQMPGCKAKSVKSNSNNDCNLQDSEAKFRTPIMLIPNNSLLSFHVKNGDYKSKLTVRDTTFHLSNNADSLKYIYLSNCSFIEFGKIDGYGKSLFIDDIKITTPREIVSHSLNDNVLSLQGLIPETKYYIEILNQDLSVANTYYFTTPKQIENFNAQILNSDTVSLSWGNNETVSNLLLSVDAVVNVADDLLISKVATKSSVNVVEIYNPTERDICLRDYEFLAYHSSLTISNAPLRYLFYEKDSIKSNNSILIALNSKVSPNDTNLVVYPVVLSSSFQGGNDSYLILKRLDENLYDTIDLFGRVKISSTDEDMASYTNSILVRKSYVRQGVKHNPDNVANVYSDWEVSAYNADVLNQMLGNHTITPTIEVLNISNTTMIAGQNSFQLTDVNFDGVYRCHIKENNNVLATTTFRMGKEISAIANGDWDNSAIWENGLKPTALDKVVLPQGVKVNIPQGVVAECAELVISSNYSTCDTLHKTEIRNNGALSVGKCVVKPCFSAYTSDGNGWTLFSLPIKIENKTRQEVAACFDIGEDDDLYYLQENYSSAASAWIPYNETIEDTNFFKQNLGYLIAYYQNKELLWQGDLFLEDELELLNNASYNSQGGEGYHLCANPYPFSVKHSNFSKNNISGMWLLSPSTGQYIPYDPNYITEFIIPPFGGFMTKVDSAENLLKIHKQEISNTSKFSSFMDKLQLTFSYEGGEDEVRIYFRENVTENIDEYDAYKLFSFGSAPDLYSTYAQKDLSIVSLPLWQDSVIIPLSYKTKNAGNYGLKIGHIPENVVRAELYNDSNELLIDFVQDSSYNFISYNSDEERSLTLKLYSFDLGIVQTSEVCDFKVIQNKNLVKIISSDRVEGVVLYNTQGIEIMQSLSDEILLPKQGCYILGVKIKGQFSFCKIIYL